MVGSIAIDAEYLKEIEKARRDLRSLISSRSCAPIMLRLAYVIFLLSFFLALSLVDLRVISTCKFPKIKRRVCCMFHGWMVPYRWHDAGTYDAKTRTGGPDGSIRHEQEYAHNANNGLKIAIDLCGELLTITARNRFLLISLFNMFCNFLFLGSVLVTEGVKAKHQRITYADLYQVFFFSFFF